MRDVRVLRCNGPCGEVKPIAVSVLVFGDGREQLGPVVCDDCKQLAGPFMLCPRCRQVVERDEPGVTYAVQLVRVDSFGGRDWVEGTGAFFHDGCPVLPGFRIKDVPEAA